MSKPQATMAELIFAIFVYLRGEDERASVAIAKRLGELMGRPNWASSGPTRDGLIGLRGMYVGLWRDSQSGEAPVDVATVEARWRAALAGLSAKAAAAHLRDMGKLIERLCEAGGAEAAGRGAELRRLEDALRPVAKVDPKAAEPKAAESKPKAVQALAGFWTKGPIRLRCVAVVDEAPDVKTFCFDAVDGRRFSYEPGQAILMEAEIDGKRVRRSYTISSSPSRPDRLAVTIKRLEGGIMSCWLHQAMAVGKELDASGPHGKLSYTHHAADKLLLVSAGSGVTPMMSMLRHLHDLRTPLDVVFLNNVRTPRDIIFAYELDAIAASLGSALRLAIIPSRPAPGMAWNGPMGRFDEALLRMVAPDCNEREVFCCGPDEYSRLVRDTLLKVGHPPERYHEERFGGARPAKVADVRAADSPRDDRQARAAPDQARPEQARGPAAPTPVATPAAAVSAQNHTISFRKQAVTLTCKPGEVLLDVAERHGVALDSACRAGACGTCRIKTSGGRLEMDDDGGLTKEELASGYVLACVARVCGDVLVDA